MKTRLMKTAAQAPTSNRNGSALVVTVVITGWLGLILASYLALVGTRHQDAMRSTAWNSAIPVLEAGIEEALTHLQRDSNSPMANSWSSETVNGQTLYAKTRPLPDGSYYSVAISNFSSVNPVIYSTGYVPSPLRPGEFISRVVEVDATNPPSGFTRAIAANGMITLGGSSVVDGYSSANGAYDPATNRTANGGIATDSTLNPAINVGSAHVYGNTVTGKNGVVAVAGASGGSVGDVTWNQSHSGIEPGWSDETMNVQFVSNAAPAAPLAPEYSDPSSGSNAMILRYDGVYAIQTSQPGYPDFKSNSQKNPLIVLANCTLYVPGNFTISGLNNPGYVYIAPNASLKLYVGGATSGIGGGGIINGSGKPANFAYYGLSSNTTLTYSGTANFVGTINAPQAAFTIGGSAQLFGAVICNTFNAGGSASVHYDTALNVPGKFTVTAWRER